MEEEYDRAEDTKEWKATLLLTPRRPQLHQHVTRLFCVWRQYAKNNLGVTNRATERVLRKFTTAERVWLRRRAANVVFLDVKCRAEEIYKRVTQVLIFVSVAYEDPGYNFFISSSPYQLMFCLGTESVSQNFCAS